MKKEKRKRFSHLRSLYVTCFRYIIYPTYTYMYWNWLLCLLVTGCEFVCENWKIILLDKTHGSLDNSFRLLGFRCIHIHI